MALIVTMANASLISQKSISLTSIPACFRAILLAGIGPNPMTLGSTPAHPMEIILARGLSPDAFAFFSDISIIIHAAAFNGEELPGVMCPSALKDGCNWARASIVVAALMLTSRSMTCFVPSGIVTSTGIISPLKNPSSSAFAAV